MSDSSPSGVLAGPLRRLGPETRLPTWMRSRYDPTSLTFLLLQVAAEEGAPLKENLFRAVTGRWLGQVQSREERLEYCVSFPGPADADVTATFATPAATGAIRRARSRFDYETAPEPTWWLDPLTRQLWLHNLPLKTVNMASPSGGYTLYEDPLPDLGVWWRRDPAQYWNWLSPDSGALVGRTLTLPFSGTFLFAYASAALAAQLASGTLTLTWNGGGTAPLPLIPQRPTNRLDGYGALFGMPRLRGEDNRAYRARMLTLLQVPPDTSVAGVERGVAAPLSQVSVLPWDGRADLVLDATGASGVTDARVIGVDRYRFVDEVLLPGADPQTFWASFPNWRSGWLVMADGIPQAGAAVSGSRVTLAQPTSGRVTAQYSLQQWSTQLLSGGTIGTLKAGTGTGSGAYRVLVVRGVRAQAPDLPSVQAARLLTPAGLPNALYRELASRLAAANPTAMGRARWGPSAAWTRGADAAAPSARLPLPFDLNQDS